MTGAEAQAYIESRGYALSGHETGAVPGGGWLASPAGVLTAGGLGRISHCQSDEPCSRGPPNVTDGRGILTGGASESPWGRDVAKPSAVATAVSTWEERLRTSLTATRAKFEHAGGKGEEAERTFRAFLRAHLPPSFRVGQGEVIDSFGQRSAQADVLVADEDQPFEVTEQPQLMIIEGVTAGAEIKVALGVTELGDAIEKGRRFKKLTAIRGKSIALTSDTIRGEPNSDIVRYYTRRPFFVFAYENHVRINTILERLAAAEDGEVVPPVDALFSLDGVVLTNTWDGKGSAKYIDQRSGHIVPGWTLNDQHPPLVSLLFWLHITMPRFAVRTSGLMHYLLAGSSWVESDTTATPLNELFMHSPATNPPAARAEWEE